MYMCVCVCVYHIVETALLIELKFGIYNIGHCQKNFIDFGHCWIYSFFTGVQKIALIHYGLLSQIVKNVLVLKQYIQLCSNFACML